MNAETNDRRVLDEKTLNPARTGWVSAMFAYVLIAVAVFGGYKLWQHVNPKPFNGTSEVTAFALLYIVAQALERFLDPIATYVGWVKTSGTGIAAQAPRDWVAAQTLVSDEPQYAGRAKKLIPGSSQLLSKRDLLFLKEHPNRKTEPDVVERLLEVVARNRTVLMWALASGLAMIVCGAFGILMLRTIGFTSAPAWADLTVTGLAVGSGTKPLHDLISNIQKSKAVKPPPV